MCRSIEVGRNKEIERQRDEGNALDVIKEKHPVSPRRALPRGPLSYQCLDTCLSTYTAVPPDQNRGPFVLWRSIEEYKMTRE